MYVPSVSEARMTRSMVLAPVNRLEQADLPGINSASGGWRVVAEDATNPGGGWHDEAVRR
jgi:hypothetical protein